MPFFRESDPEVVPIKDLTLTLDDIYLLFDIVSRKDTENPCPTEVGRIMERNIATGLFELWLYHSKRAKDLSRYTLTIKK